MTSCSLRIFSKIKKIRYLFHLTVQYFIDFAIPNGSKDIRTNEINIKESQNFLIKAQPLLELFQVNNKKGEILHKANNIMYHDFILFGKIFSFLPNQSDTFGSYQPINWHYDPSSKNEFSRKDWYRLIRKNIPKGSDLKYPWELSRFQHLTLLGQAYTITAEEKYTLEFVNQITDWIENNPVRYGINWACTMEVGIRIANWIVGLMYFIESDTIDVEFLTLFNNSAMVHGDHIYNNLENLQVYTSNHYAANIAGLFILSVYLPRSTRIRRWQKFAFKELESEIINQTYESGWQYESSTSYHRLVTEMFLYSYLFGKAFNIFFSNKYVNRLKKMLDVLSIVSKPGGAIPQIGDNDSGRFLVFNFDKNYDDLDVGYLMNTAVKQEGLLTENHFSFPYIYDDAGRFIWKNENLYMILVAGPKGQGGNGGHAHNDILSYELNVDGYDIIVDPGTFVYTGNPKERNYFRSVKNHNTLCWKDLEPCSLHEGLFTLREKGKLKVDSITDSKSITTIVGFYEYGERFHKRSISVDAIDRIITVDDECSHLEAMINFNISPGRKINQKDSEIFIDSIRIKFDGISSFSVEPSYYSPAYGKKQDSKILRGRLSGLKCSHSIFY